MSKKRRIEEAESVLADLGMPRPQLNKRTALCLLALLNLLSGKSWDKAQAPRMGITPIMDWARVHYGESYAPNTRETFRRQSMHQFIQAGIAVYNPDEPNRPVNSPHAVYQIEPNLLAVLKTYGTARYAKNLKHYLAERKTLVQKYARERVMNMVPVRIKEGQKIRLSAGPHSGLIKAIVEDFAGRYASGGELVYAGDTGDKFGYFDEDILSKLKIKLDTHGKMPDVVIFLRKKNWLLLIEAVTSHGPVDSKRHEELSKLFKQSTAGLVFVSAFPNRKVFLKHLEFIAWETEAWIADAPSHLIHFNGIRFLGPYENIG